MEPKDPKMAMGQQDNQPERTRSVNGSLFPFTNELFLVPFLDPQLYHPL